MFVIFIHEGLNFYLVPALFNYTKLMTPCRCIKYMWIATVTNSDRC